FSFFFIYDHFVSLFKRKNLIKIRFCYTKKALPVRERRCDVQMTIALFVVTIIICPVLTGIIANYLYDKFK
ncbi:hypothetical protein, partial [Staphylococcus argensis]|uniref:hypothetical protein n=1 Tax=Staphylococcus argensis TaxID=1607738 RepID=UPI001C930687